MDNWLKSLGNLKLDDGSLRLIVTGATVVLFLIVIFDAFGSRGRAILAQQDLRAEEPEGSTASVPSVYRVPRDLASEAAVAAAARTEVAEVDAEDMTEELAEADAAPEDMAAEEVADEAAETDMAEPAAPEDASDDAVEPEVAGSDATEDTAIETDVAEAEATEDGVETEAAEAEVTEESMETEVAEAEATEDAAEEMASEDAATEGADQEVAEAEATEDATEDMAAAEAREDESEPEVAEADATQDDGLALLANADISNGENVWRQCRACHVHDAEQNRGGPHLVNIIGREVGAAEGWRYSRALSEHGGVWTVESLLAWLEDPDSYIPGNQMAFRGLRNEQDRIDVLGFLNN